MSKNKRVAVGISGGVDSAMAAYLLKQDGYEVIGVTMAIWDDSIPILESTKGGCFGPGEKEDLEAAVALCKKMGIEHHIIRLKDEYRDNVLSYFCGTYIDGKTPNPCLMCNVRMKFGLLPQKAKAQGIQFENFATGHYVQHGYDKVSCRYQLMKAVDSSKDQSYFLSFLIQEQLSNLIFPLGDKTKTEIKMLAKELGYGELADKKESQDFLESDDISVLFSDDSYFPGEIVDMDGKVLGTHTGIINYTIGQRRNLGVSGQSEPYYVIEIDAAYNKVVLGPKQYLYSKECIATNVNWLSISCPRKAFTAQAKIRLQHTAAACVVTPLVNGTLRVVFQEAQLSITPGQGIVFYDKDIVLAGGIIQ